MRFLWPQLSGWIDAGEPFALATVTAVSGSAPRAPGSCMAIMPDAGRFLGSVSSGCLDVEVVDAARRALATGSMQRLRFGPVPATEAPWTQGLTCGGWIDLRIDPWWSFHPRPAVAAVGGMVRSWLADERAQGVVLSDETRHLAVGSDGGTAGDAGGFAPSWVERALQHLHEGRPPLEMEGDGGAVFVRTVRPRPRMLLVGAVDVSARLVPLAHEAGFSTIVVDPRAAYVADERFPHRPGRMVRSWPQAVVAEAALGPRDVALALTHDPKIDDAALQELLETPVGYVGALGSVRSHEARCARLRDAGVGEAALQRIQGPAGLHLGVPDAVGIAAGILAGVLQWQSTAEQRRRESAGTPARA